jgi:hypothetical protein
MNQFTPKDWLELGAELVTIVTVVFGYLDQRLRLNKGINTVTGKLDTNTALTQDNHDAITSATEKIDTNTALTQNNQDAIAITQVAVAQTKNVVSDTKDAMNALERHTNSKLDALLKVTGESEKAKGKLEGRAEVTAENEQRGN